LACTAGLNSLAQLAQHPRPRLAIKAASDFGLKATSIARVAVCANKQMPDIVVYLVVFGLGFAAGYAVREYISRQRRREHY
jgi:hypothetical protein